MQSWFESSGPGRVLGRLGALPVRLWAQFSPQKEAPGGLMPHQWAFLAGFALMLCVPHDYWNNLYAPVLALLMLLLYWRDCAVYGREAVNPAVLGPGVLVFLLWCFVCTLWAKNRGGSLRVAVFYLTGFVFAYLAAASFRTGRERRALTGMLYAVLVVTAAFGLFEYAFGSIYYTVPIDGVLYRRLCATLEHGINYGEFIAMVFPLALLFAVKAPGKKQRTLFLALLLPLAALLLTYARTGWIAFGLAVLLLLWYADKRLLIPAAVLGVVGFLLLPESLRARFFSMFQFTNTSASGRFVLWSECLHLLRDRWALGVGLGPENFYNAYLPYCTGVLDFAPPHANMGYLEIFCSLGIVGFAAFCAFFFGVFRRLGRALKGREMRSDKWEVYPLIASLAGAALGNIPEHLWFYPRVLFTWCLLFGMALSVSGETEARS